MTTLTKAQLQDSIAKQATETRTHLVCALNGIDEIIRLATTAGRTDVVKAAQAVKRSAQEAAQSFNNDVVANDGDPTKMDPIVIKAADEAADEALASLRNLYTQLDEKVKGIDDNVKLWGFGTERDAAGMPLPTKNTWTAWTTGDIVKHNVTLYGPDGKSGLVKDVADAQASATQALTEAQAANWRPVSLPTVAILIGAFFLFWGILGFGWGMVWAAGSATAAVIAALVTFILTNRTNNRPAR